MNNNNNLELTEQNCYVLMEFRKGGQRFPSVLHACLIVIYLFPFPIKVSRNDLCTIQIFERGG